MVASSSTATALGTVGTVLWCVQLIPQIWFLHKRRNAEGFSPLFMFLWCLSAVPMGIYFVVANSYTIFQVQPHLFGLFCSVAWVQSMYYPPYQMGLRRIALILGSFLVFWIGCEVGFVVWLRPLYAKGNESPDLVFGIIATVVLSLGLLPPYYELAKRQGRVVGINFLFLAMDSAGAIFSMISMLVGTFDPMGMSLYVVILALEVGLFASQAVWWLRFGRRRNEKDKLKRCTDETHLENTVSLQDVESQCPTGTRSVENANSFTHVRQWFSILSKRSQKPRESQTATYPTLDPNPSQNIQFDRADVSVDSQQEDTKRTTTERVQRTIENSKA